MQLEFSSFNVVRNVDVLSAKSAEALRDLIKSLKMEVSIISIYFDGKNHLAWVQTNFPIKRKSNLKGV
jgi:hypothetical protein